MKKELFGNIKNYLLIILSFALIITGVQLYQEKQESRRQYELFLNHFYFELTSAIQSLHSVLETPLEGNELEQALLHVEQDLERTDFMLDAGSHFANRNIGHASIFSDHPIMQFADDNTLTNEEMRYLENLNKDLDTIQTGLYSDETKQENPNLSIHAFNNVIRGSGLNSGFLTERKSVAVPFQVISPEQAPDRIRKWIEQNASAEQKKVFNVDGRTYVLIVSGHRREGLQQVEINDMVRRGDGIAVAHEREEQSIQSQVDEQKTTVAIAKLEIETGRSFQFTTPLETDEENENPAGNNTSHSASAAAELVSPEELSKDGQIVE